MKFNNRHKIKRRGKIRAIQNRKYLLKNKKVNNNMTKKHCKKTKKNK